METSSLAPTARTLEVPGAHLYYEVRGRGPLVVLVGAPMDARPFGPLADLLAGDYTVLTTDPRGINRSPVDDPGQDSTPELRADDLSRLVACVDAGPAVVLGSSGGAVSALALVQAHPELVRGVFEAMFGGKPDAWAMADTTFQNTHMLRPTARFVPDVAVLRSAGARVVVGIGEASAGQVCDRTSRALASALGIEPTMFPGGHTGFAQDPAGFAVRLRSVFAG